jgi:uncharacterized protein (TIGR03437 family)
VSNPGGAVSGALNFTVTAIAPTVSAVSPQSVTATGPAFTIEVSGTGFLPGARVLWNGVALETTWLSASRLSVLVAAGLTSEPCAVAISVSTSAGLSNPVAFAVNPVAPFADSAGILNSGSWTRSIAPGSLISIFGTNLSTGTASAAATPLPFELAGSSIVVNGSPAPLLYVSPTQINAQVPYETRTGAASLTIKSGKVTGEPVAFNVVANGPGVMMIPQTNHALGVNYPEGSINSAQHPATPGEFLILYIIGQGQVDNPVPTGAAAPFSPLSNALAPVRAIIGGQDAQVLFAGLLPGYVGVLQVNLLVPLVPSGEHVLQVTIGEASANATTVSIGGS